MMDNDRLTLVQPEGAISHHAMQQRSMWREIFTPVVMMYTLAYFCLTNTLSAISIWTPQILQSLIRAAVISPSACWPPYRRFVPFSGWSTGAVTQIAARNEGITPPFLICSLPQVGYWLRQLITT